MGEITSIFAVEVSSGNVCKTSARYAPGRKRGLGDVGCMHCASSTHIPNVPPECMTRICGNSFASSVSFPFARRFPCVSPGSVLKALCVAVRGWGCMSAVCASASREGGCADVAVCMEVCVGLCVFV